MQNSCQSADCRKVGHIFVSVFNNRCCDGGYQNFDREAQRAVECVCHAVTSSILAHVAWMCQL